MPEVWRRALGSGDGAAGHRDLPREEANEEDDDVDPAEVLRMRIPVGTARAFDKRTYAGRRVTHAV